MQKLFYIDYPQEAYEGQAHRYRCAFCQEETTKINGRLEGHLPSCEYRVQQEKAEAVASKVGVAYAASSSSTA